MVTSIVLLAAGSALLAVGRPPLEFPTSAGPLRLTPVKHASLMLEAGGQVVHIDPWGEANYAGAPQADIILITHTHGDHLDPKALARVRKAGTVLIAPEAVAATVAGVKVLRNGQETEVGKWRIAAVPMYNLQRGPSPGRVYHEKGVGNGYVVGYGGFRLYVAGDTENIPEMRSLGSIDVALIPMNLPYTMTAEEAAEAVKTFKPKVAIPYHYRGTDLSIFQKALGGSGVEVKIVDWYN